MLLLLDAAMLLQQGAVVQGVQGSSICHGSRQAATSILQQQAGYSSHSQQGKQKYSLVRPCRTSTALAAQCRDVNPGTSKGEALDNGCNWQSTYAWSCAWLC